MKRIFAVVLSALCAAWALPSAAFERVMTAPRVPSAGQATTLVFRAIVAGPDLDPSTLPVASVNGASIRVDLNAECMQVFCDVLENRLFRVELPALDEGEYQMGLFYSAQVSQPSDSLVFAVGPEADATSRRPAEGAWYDASRPGTGLYLQTRGPLLSVAQFDYVEGRSQWRLDVTPMHGDQALVLLRDFSNGSCFGCDPFTAPSTRLGGTPLLITFESARRARAELLDGSVVPMVSLPFGVDYVPLTLTDLADAEFGPLPLPDLSGTWAYQNRVVAFGPAEIEDGIARFPAVGESLIELSCGTNVLGSARCVLLALPSPSGPVLGAPIPPIAFALLGDIEENRIRMVSATPEGDDFYMVRIPSAD